MPEEILGIEISSREVRYINVERRQKEFVVEKCGRIALPAFSLSTPGDLSKVLQDVILTEKISPSKVCVTVSYDDLFIQQAVLPKMPEGELKGIIRSEIERIPKFANKGFDFVHAQFVTEEQKFMVIFSALAQERRDYYLEAVRRANLSIESLEISPLNLLEIFYSRLPKNSVEGLIVLGEANSRIMIFSQNECKLFFQMAVGKKDLYISDKEIKNSVFLSWTEEIRRVLKSYQRQFAETSIDRIWMVWDSQNCLDMADMLSKSLEIEISAPAFQDFGVRMSEETNPAYFIPLAGALLYLKSTKQRFDSSVFLKNIKLKDAIKSTGKFILIYSAAALIATVVLVTWFTAARNAVLKKRSQAAERTAILEKENALLNSEKSKLIIMRNLLMAQAKLVSSLHKTPWINIFDQLIKGLPANVTIGQFELSESLVIRLDCSTFSISSIAEFMRNINKNPAFANTQFDFLKERESDGRRMVEFSLNTTYKENGS